MTEHMFRCNMMDQCDNPDCEHYRPHKPHGLSTCCGVDFCADVDDAPWCTTYFPHPDVVELADKVLKWWEDAQYTTVPCGDEDWDNLYDEPPGFVKEARKIKEEVTIE